jgi:hypothetical protein
MSDADVSKRSLAFSRPSELGACSYGYKIIKATEKTHLWPELVFLYIKYKRACTNAFHSVSRLIAHAHDCIG